MKFNRSLSSIIFFLLFSIQTQAQKADEVFDYGKLDNGRYANDFFKLEVDVPQDWSVQTKEQMEAIHEKGKELIAGDDETMKAIVKASDVNSAKLFMAYQYEVGSAVDFNPSFALMAENIKQAPGVKTGSDYLFQARKFIAKSQIKYKHIDEKFKKEVINGTDFYKMTTKITYLGTDISQVYYCTVLKGFSLIFIISFSEKEQEKELKKLVSTITIKK
ncbi:MAG: hypothetical protein JWM14_1763 [Chitinophagaceae bacterium]|nr:hypothetical protein [Chitinophagaceae bacterium]